jgi:hypothetical protein
MTRARRIRRPPLTEGIVAEWDPVLPEDEAGEYCGCSGKTLERMNLERQPIPATGTKRQRWGYRLSVLNTFLEQIKDPQSRKPMVRTP